MSAHAITPAMMETPAFSSASRRQRLSAQKDFAISQYPNFVTVAEVIAAVGSKRSSATAVQAGFRDIRKLGFRVDSQVNEEGVCTYRVWPDGDPKDSIIANVQKLRRDNPTAINTAQATAWFAAQYPKFHTMRDAAEALGVPLDKVNALYMRMAYEHRQGGAYHFESKNMGGGLWMYRLVPTTPAEDGDANL